MNKETILEERLAAAEELIMRYSKLIPADDLYVHWQTLSQVQIPSQPPSSVLREALEKIISLPGEWNDAKQIARKGLADFKYPGMNHKIIPSSSGDQEGGIGWFLQDIDIILDYAISDKEKIKMIESALSKFLDALAASPVEDNQEKAGPEVRDVKKWPPEKDGWYWCVVEGRPSALGKWLLKLEYNKSEGGFLQEDDGYIPIQYLTNDLQITIHNH